MNCLRCAHCRIDFGEPHYSDETPGSGGVWECRKGHWEFEAGSGDVDKGSLEDALNSADKCSHFTPEKKP